MQAPGLLSTLSDLKVVVPTKTAVGYAPLGIASHDAMASPDTLD
ncbi:MULTISPECIES: hypothetical protein [Cupriavidus]|nr:hypothetical protein [Cupriavidus taiwanensis]